ncbi:uncharacterized protein YALI1_A06615g [Yarrowia lipolytica]|uniref:Uncharacterized protein n=1 Tax=Yarrowia lipolytica TaxID=4952 RepID=A0A1D8N3X4_YARLL|nr:hypothetical protein YALI1_A06615g [Yarrowia lipolytica]
MLMERKNVIDYCTEMMSSSRCGARKMYSVLSHVIMPYYEGLCCRFSSMATVTRPVRTVWPRNYSSCLKPGTPDPCHPEE